MGMASRRQRKDRPYLEAVSAGGAVFRSNGKILLLRKSDERRWCLPKGGVEDGESAEEAAVREIREEAGLYCQPAGHLTDVRYQYYWIPEEVNYDKTVHYYLMEVVGGSVRLERGFDRFRWCTEKEAIHLLRYDNDKRVVRNAFSQLRKIRGSSDD